MCGMTTSVTRTSTRPFSLRQHPRVHVHRHRVARARQELRSKRARRAVGTLADHLHDRVDIAGAEDPALVEHPQIFAEAARDLLAAAIDGRDRAAPIVDDHDLARPIEQIVETRLERNFAGELAADGFFPRLTAAI